jgi:hypothetical protein
VREALAAAFRMLPVELPAAGLRDLLYTRFFARAAATACVPEVFTGLVPALSAANQGRDAWLSGWRIDTVEPGGAIVVSHVAERRSVRAGNYAMTFSEELPPRPGCGVTLRHCRESLTFQAGVYYAFGDVSPEPGEEAAALRIYLHAAQGSAVPVFALLTGELNRLRVPFTLKTMLRPDDRDRCDATLLYLPSHYFPLFKKVSVPLRSVLAPGIPLFTKPLAPGMGLAESPVTAESFGMHRCRLVAEGVMEAWSAGRQDEESRWASVERRFAADGLSLARPYLNAGSDDVY